MTAKRIGDYLVSRGFVSESQLEEALLDQQDAFAHKFLGEIFVEKEILNKEEFEEHLESFLSQRGMDTPQEEKLLGNLLVKGGVISEAQLQAALAKQQAMNEPLFLGEIMVEEGMLTVHQLEVYLKNQQLMNGEK